MNENVKYEKVTRNCPFYWFEQRADIRFHLIIIKFVIIAYSYTEDDSFRPLFPGRLTQK
jgi:hypothetical protein